MANENLLNVTPESLKQLKAKFDRITHGDPKSHWDRVFKFQGHALVVGYAYYLIQYAESQLGKA